MGLEKVEAAHAHVQVPLLSWSQVGEQQNEESTGWFREEKALAETGGLCKQGVRSCCKMELG